MQKVEEKLGNVRLEDGESGGWGKEKSQSSKKTSCLRGEKGAG